MSWLQEHEVIPSSCLQGRCNLNVNICCGFCLKETLKVQTLLVSMRGRLRLPALVLASFLFSALPLRGLNISTATEKKSLPLQIRACTPQSCLWVCLCGKDESGALQKPLIPAEQDLYFRLQTNSLKSRSSVKKIWDSTAVQQANLCHGLVQATGQGAVWMGAKFHSFPPVFHR